MQYLARGVRHPLEVDVVPIEVVDRRARNPPLPAAAHLAREVDVEIDLRTLAQQALEGVVDDAVARDTVCIPTGTRPDSNRSAAIVRRD